jgi:TPP-dependent pyruvate/acetoin dehydrogenase alpha subunit
MHIADFSVGMLGAIAIVGAGIPIATGAGWTCKYRRRGQVAVSFFGDGAANEGSFHEGINLAAVWGLPVIFVCENNVYGFSTHYRRVTLIEHIADRASSYGIPGVIVDGMDLRAVYRAAGEAIERARNGGGPTLLECKTYRFMGHSRFEKSTYRSKDELEQWKGRDPIVLFRAYLCKDLNVDEQELARIDEEILEEIEEAVKYAESSSDPGPEDYKDFIYA